MNLALVKNLSILKIVNIFGYFFNKTFKPKINFFKPISIDIEPTIFCNLSCPFCHSKNLAREKKLMSLNEFKKVLDNFPLAIKINIQGMGEPLINKEIVEMIKYAKKNKKFVTITTNGTLLDNKVSEELINSGLDRLIISFDSADKETYEKSRVGANFEKVIENISNFVKLKNKKNPQVIIWMLGLKETIKSLPAMVDLVERIGADELVLQSKLTNWGKDEWMEKNKKMETDFETEEIDKIIKEAKVKAKKLKINFKINNKYTFFKKDKQEKCNWPWGGAYVATDGSISPCCLIADPKVALMGNVFEEDFKKIWNKEKYQNLRKNIKNGDIPHYCQGCYK